MTEPEDHMVVSLAEASIQQIFDQLMRRYECVLMLGEGAPGKSEEVFNRYGGGYSRMLGMAELFLAFCKAKNSKVWIEADEATETDGPGDGAAEPETD